MKALSVRAPWWWFILYGGKDIENRDWPTSFRGTIYLHASKWWSTLDVSEDEETAARCRRIARDMGRGSQPDYQEMRASGGCIVGQVDIVGCVTQSDSPWFFGRYGFVLANPVAFAKPIPCKGHLGFFDPDVEAALPGRIAEGQSSLFGGETR
jgi:hypothetical protein